MFNPRQILKNLLSQKHRREWLPEVGSRAEKGLRVARKYKRRVGTGIVCHFAPSLFTSTYCPPGSSTVPGMTKRFSWCVHETLPLSLVTKCLSFQTLSTVKSVSTWHGKRSLQHTDFMSMDIYFV